MSNKLCLVATQFTNIREIDSATGQPVTSYGFRIYDSYGKDYSNTFEKSEVDVGDEDLFCLAKKHVSDERLDFDFENGIEINGTFYERSELP